MKKIGQQHFVVLPKDAVPTDAGNYKAVITVDGVIAYVEYTI